MNLRQKTTTIIWTLVGFALAFPAFADTDKTQNPGTDKTQNPAGPITIPNPLGELDTFQELFQAIINIAIFFAAPILTLMIVVAGFYYLFSGSDPGKRATALNIIKYGIIGLVVILLARLIAAAVPGVF